jgi:hypothetical protein
MGRQRHQVSLRRKDQTDERTRVHPTNQKSGFTKWLIPPNCPVGHDSSFVDFPAQESELLWYTFETILITW